MPPKKKRKKNQSTNRSAISDLSQSSRRTRLPLRIRDGLDPNSEIFRQYTNSKITKPISIDIGTTQSIVWQESRGVKKIAINEIGEDTADKLDVLVNHIQDIITRGLRAEIPNEIIIGIGIIDAEDQDSFTQSINNLFPGLVVTFAGGLPDADPSAPFDGHPEGKSINRKREVEEEEPEDAGGDKTGSSSNRNNSGEPEQKRRRANTPDRGDEQGGNDEAVGAGGSGDDPGDEDDPSDDDNPGDEDAAPKKAKAKKKKTKKEKEEEEKKRQLRIKTIPKVSKRVGLSIDKSGKLNHEGKDSKKVAFVYEKRDRVVDFLETLKLEELPVILGEDSPPPINIPSALLTEISPQVIEEINLVRTLDDLNLLLSKYEKNEDIDAYLAVIIHHKDILDSDDQKKRVSIFEKILSPITLNEDSLPSDEDLAILDELAARYNAGKRKIVLDSVAAIKEALKYYKLVESDYGNLEELENYHGEIEEVIQEEEVDIEELEVEEEEELERRNEKPGKEALALIAIYDYANTLFAQFRDAAEHPWKVLSRDEELVEGAVTNDTKLERLATLFAAQLGLRLQQLHTPVNSTLFRWAEGIEEHNATDLISPLALYSTSMGSQSTETFGGKNDRTLFIIINPKTGKFIQPISGTKNWFQREVLFPAHVQFIVRQKEIISDIPGKKEVWYVIEELDFPVYQILDSVIDGFSIPQDFIEYPFYPSFLIDSLVDKRHRDHFEENPNPSIKDLKAANIEVDDDIVEIDGRFLYGIQTHKRWDTVMKSKIERRDLLKEATLLELYKVLLGLPEAVYRDYEVGWGDGNHYETLDPRKRNNLKANRILFFPTLAPDEIEGFLSWITKLKKGTKITSIEKDEISPAEYHKRIQERRADLKPNERLAVAAGILQAYRGKKSYNPNTQQYEVTHGSPLKEDGTNIIPIQIVKILNEAANALEQTLALYQQKVFSGVDYIEKIQRVAARLQQKIVALHPFKDGNGRLSRLMMYKALQAYYPTDYLLEIGLPLIEDTNLDLVSSREEWFQYVFKGIHPITSDSDISDDVFDREEDDSLGFGAPPETSSKGKSNEILTLSSPAAGPALRVFSTSGLGNCGIHAMFGEPNAYDYYHAGNYQEIRARLATALKREIPRPIRNNYIAQLGDLLQQIHIKLIGGQPLTRDENLLWTEFNKSDGFLETLGKTIAEESGNDPENERRINAIINRFMVALKDDRTPQFDELKRFFISEILASKSELNEEIKRSLRLKQTTLQQINLVIAKGDDYLRKAVYNQLERLLDRSASSRHFRTQRRLYAESQEYLRGRENSYRIFVEANFDRLIPLYSNFIAQDGVYLRQEDLELLASIYQKQLIIYRRDNESLKDYHVIRRYGEDRPDLIEIFHDGVHYERAELIRPVEIAEPAELAELELIE